MHRLLPALLSIASVTSSVAASTSTVAVAGYDTGREILAKLLPGAGMTGANHIDQALPADSYKDFSAILWVEQIKDVEALGADTLWDQPANQQQVMDYVRNGGRIVTTAHAIPVPAARIRALGPLSELTGITGVAKPKVLPNIKILDPTDPLFAGLSIPQEGFQWGGDYARGARAAESGKVLATVESEDGQTLPFITVNEIGKGRFYWFGAVPKRLEQNGIPAEQLAAFETVLLRALGYTGKPVTAPAAALGTGVEPTAAAKAAGWGVTPLGKDLTPPSPSPEKPPGSAVPGRTVESLPGDPLPLAASGEARAFIVLADVPSNAARQAADLLRREIQATTGAELPVFAESKVTVGDGGRLMVADHVELVTALVVGETETGKSRDLDPGVFPEEGYRIEPIGNAIYMLGRDRSARGLETYGTRFAVLDFLESTAGVRWLWPGETGTVRPHNPTLAASRYRTRDAPTLAIRKLRNLGAIGSAYHNEGSESRAGSEFKLPNRDALTGFTRRMADGIELMGIDYSQFLKKHAGGLQWFETARLGSHLRLNAGHAFHGWYEKYHADHPDWFALQPDGTRKQVPVRETFCTSNDGFRDAAAKQVLDQMAADPTSDGWSASLNDGGQNAFCMCEACRSQDPPDGPKISFRYELKDKEFQIPYVSLTDRILDYYNGLAERVVKVLPTALVGAQAYSYYRTPPMQTPVHPALVISFVGLSYLDHSRHFTDKESWDRWAALSDRLILRPNTLHTGHGYPAVFVNRLADDLRHCQRTGMIGADFDSVCHHWATQGLNYYVLSRLLWNPELNAGKIVDDYCEAAFGAGAPPMKRYFERVEEITETVAGNVGKAVETALRDEEDLNAARFALAKQLEELNRAYSSDVESGLRGLLEEATRLAGDDKASKARIAFVGRGLDYVAAQRKFYAAVDSGGGADHLADRNKTLSDLFENEYFAVNIPVLLWRETALISRLGGAKPRPQ